MGAHTRPECPVDAPGGSAAMSSALLDSRLLGYRAAVDDLVKEAARRPGSSGLPAAEALVARRLDGPEFTPVLSRLDGGVDVAAARLIREIRNYRPCVRSSASDLPALVRIFLLSQIDSAWWRGTAPFVSHADVLCSAELVDLRPLRSAKMLQFQYRAQPAGLRFTRSRPAVVAVVNQIGSELAAALPQTPRLWVTSMVRSVQHQLHLRSLGYAAVLPSSHCVGYACDLEMHWFRRFDQDNLLARLLFEHQAAGQLNVIDEGQAWHLCVNPLACGELQAAYDAQLRVR